MASADRGMRKAGALLAALIASGASGYGLKAALDAAAEAATPESDRKKTQLQHAQDNLGNILVENPKLTKKEAALYEGVRQGMMAGIISDADVNAMAAAGQFPARVLRLLSEVHDWSVAGGQIPALQQAWEPGGAGELSGPA